MRLLNMPQVIEIAVPVEDIEARRLRLEKARRFEEPDRVPVVPALAHRFLVPKTGVLFRDYIGLLGVGPIQLIDNHRVRPS